jgi:uncharacterized protein (DUF849 family)
LRNTCIVTAAITGGDVTPTQAPHLPITPAQIVDEAVRCAEAGAAIVHVHVRDPATGEPSSRLDLFEEVLTGIKRRSDVIVCPTTGGNASMTLDERLAILPRFKPEMATFNTGSMNYSSHFVVESYDRRGKAFKHEWEREHHASSKDGVFRNSFSDLERTLGLMNENEVKPECEIYDLGMIYNVAFLVQRGLLHGPLRIQFVLGVLGGARAQADVLMFMKNVADGQFGAGRYTWSTVGAGFPQGFELGALSLLLGGSIRVGMEDNPKLATDTLATSNAQLVDKAVAILRVLDRQPATPDDARRMLGLKGLSAVAY